MTTSEAAETATDWVRLEPRFAAAPTHRRFVDAVCELWTAALQASDATEHDILDRLLQDIPKAAARRPSDDQAAFSAAMHVVSDLCRQGWLMRIVKGKVEVSAPVGAQDRSAEKDRVRAQELVKRDEQLREPAVRKFVEEMERPRLHGRALRTIFSVMRDGRDLARDLAALRPTPEAARADALVRVIDPYLQFVDESATCEHTGLRLMDIWRYFRHTWSNQYTSIPGRTMMYLVRDRAALNHPVIGIGALGSPIVQIQTRDSEIGWLPREFLRAMRETPTDEMAKWLVAVVDDAIAHIYTKDLIADESLPVGAMKKPTERAIERLIVVGREARKQHHRFAAAAEFKGRLADASSQFPAWEARARTHLFRSKRALTLAELLRARLVLQCFMGKRPTAAGLTALLVARDGRRVAARVVRKAKGDRVGIAMADIIVCGAVPPYNAVLGGKLLCMLSASPEVVEAYAARYASAESEIASAMAGRAVVRAPHLVYLGTTSLYGAGSSQYNRVRVPGVVLGGRDDDEIRYRELGRSCAFGTSQFSAETIDALVKLTEQSDQGARVNSIFGEGVSPKLRKVRDGLALLGLPTDRLLRHGRERIVYGVPLVRNVLRYLLGLDPRPEYVFSVGGKKAGEAIASWWRSRWLARRIESDAVLAEVERHTLVRPVRHGARVVLPALDADEIPLFGDTES